MPCARTQQCQLFEPVFAVVFGPCVRAGHGVLKRPENTQQQLPEPIVCLYFHGLGFACAATEISSLDTQIKTFKTPNWI